MLHFPELIRPGSRWIGPVGATVTWLLTSAPAHAASALPKAGDPVGVGDFGWIAGVGVLVVLVGLVLRRRRSGR